MLPNQTFGTLVYYCLCLRYITSFADSIESDENETSPIKLSRSKRDYEGDIGTLHKRPRQFVGKRYGNTYFDLIEKRPRQFVGKRDYISGSHEQAKRPRQFVGKRNFEDDWKPLAFRPKVLIGKRSDLFEDVYDPDNYFLNENDEALVRNIILEDIQPPISHLTSDLDVAKRPRQFVGKRMFSSFLDNLDPQDYYNEQYFEQPFETIGKRPRMFVGKRPRMFVGKRPRMFVGKRSNIEKMVDDLYQDLTKRPRQFVGKREVSKELELRKRPRQFVGKRSSYFESFEKRPRQFVGKRESGDQPLTYAKRPRQFVGKRLVGQIEEDFDMEKRPRQFVGKRSDDDDEEDDAEEVESFLEKRPRQFVGKRSAEMLNKRRR